MPDPTAHSSQKRLDRVSDRRIVFQAVLSLWAYSVVCGSLAVGVGYLVGAALTSVLPAPAVRIGTAALVALTGGLSGPRVLTHVEKRLGLLPDAAAADNWVNQAKRKRSHEPSPR
jgi:hypothetical protein